MRILIIGAGAIGTMLGTALSKNNEIVFYIRESKIEQFKKSELTVNFGNDIKKLSNPQAISSFSQIQNPFDLAILSVKSYNTDEILEDLDTKAFNLITTCQNGIGNEEKLINKYGADKVVSSVITLPAAKNQDGSVSVTNLKGGISFGKTSDKIRLDKIADIFSEAGFKTSICDNYADMKWSKVLLNMNSNALSAITSMTMEELFKSFSAVSVEKKLFKEALCLLNKNNIKTVDLPGYPVKAMCIMYDYLPEKAISAIMLISGKAKSRGKKMPSLYIDIEQGKKNSEIDVVNGAIKVLGERTGEKTPFNSFICNLLHSILEGKIPRNKYRNNPKLLLEDMLSQTGRE